MTNPKVAIIILNWKGWEDTIECLESLYQITYPDYEVIVVDNNSEDDSIEKIKEYAKGKTEVGSRFFEYDPGNKPVKIIEYTREESEAIGGKEGKILDLPSNRKMIIIKNDENYGFAEGNNIGMRYALETLNPDYILLLNNDTVVDPEFLGELVGVAGSDPRIGVVGPKMYYYDFDGRKDVIWFAGGKIRWWKGTANHIGLKKVGSRYFNKMKVVDYISGCAMLINQNAIQKVGFLDNRFILYFEDVEWNIRFKKGGYDIVYVPNAVIYHKVSMSSRRIGAKRVYYAHRNRILFLKKHCPKKYFIVLPFTLFGRFMMALGYYAVGGKIKHCAELIKAYWAGLFLLP